MTKSTHFVFYIWEVSIFFFFPCRSFRGSTTLVLESPSEITSHLFCQVCLHHHVATVAKAFWVGSLPPNRSPPQVSVVFLTSKSDHASLSLQPFFHRLVIGQAPLPDLASTLSFSNCKLLISPKPTRLSHLPGILHSLFPWKATISLTAKHLLKPQGFSIVPDRAWFSFLYVPCAWWLII